MAEHHDEWCSAIQSNGNRIQDHQPHTTMRRLFPNASIACPQPPLLAEDTTQSTNIGLEPDYCFGRPRRAGDPHGPGPVMLAGAEILAANSK
jgi:hypothetical protein